MIKLTLTTATSTVSTLAAGITSDETFTATHSADATTLIITKTALFELIFWDRANALEQVSAVGADLLTITVLLSKMGFVSNTMDHTLSNLTNSVSILSVGKCGIEKADFAVETTN